MKIAVASGKGGTGKTLIATNLFNVIQDKVVYADCDVEEPNGHLFLKPKQLKTEKVEIKIPDIDTKKCNYCGKCAELCQFKAIVVASNKVLVFSEMCHGCGSCTYFCPEKAISEKPRNIGVIEKGVYQNKIIITGRLNIGEPMAPPVIKKIKRYIQNVQDMVIIDSPPGTSCPVIESINGSDYVVLVTEPTPFGLHDLKLVVEVVRKLALPFGIVENKSGLGNSMIQDYCKVEKIKVLLEIPYDNKIAQMYSKGELISKEDKYKNIFIDLANKIKE